MLFGGNCLACMYLICVHPLVFGSAVRAPGPTAYKWQMLGKGARAMVGFPCIKSGACPPGCEFSMFSNTVEAGFHGSQDHCSSAPHSPVPVETTNRRAPWATTSVSIKSISDTDRYEQQRLQRRNLRLAAISLAPKAQCCGF